MKGDEKEVRKWRTCLRVPSAVQCAQHFVMLLVDDSGLKQLQ